MSSGAGAEKPLRSMVPRSGLRKTCQKPGLRQGAVEAGNDFEVLGDGADAVAAAGDDRGAGLRVQTYPSGSWQTLPARPVPRQIAHNRVKSLATQ